jgi:hypothetical protein
MRIWIENIAPATNDDEIKELVRKYAPELICESIMRVEGAGSHPGALVQLVGGPINSAENLCRRLSGMYWKQRGLACSKIGTFER